MSSEAQNLLEFCEISILSKSRLNLPKYLKWNTAIHSFSRKLISDDGDRRGFVGQFWVLQTNFHITICVTLSKQISLPIKNNKLCLKCRYTPFVALQPKHENICTYVMTSPGGFHFPQHKDRGEEAK